MERILVLGLSSDRGGIENYILNLYKNIDNTKLQFDFLVKEDLCEDYKELVNSLGGQIFVVGTFKRDICKVWSYLSALYKDNLYEKIYVNMSYAPALIYIIPAIHSGLKVLFLHSHASDDIRKIPHYIFRILFYKILLKNVKCVYMGCSLEACKWQYGKNVFKREKMHVINNAVDYNRFKYSEQKRNAIREKFGIPQEAFVIGHVGRFSQEKNHDFIVRAFKEFVTSREKNAYLLLVGDGYLRETIEEKVSKDGLKDRVIFVGGVEDTSPYYSAMDYFWLPSLYEGFPIVVVEAQVNGLRCICSSNVTDKTNILQLVEFQSINSIDKWLNIADVNILKSSRLISREKLIESGFDLSNQVENIEELLMKKEY